MQHSRMQSCELQARASHPTDRSRLAYASARRGEEPRAISRHWCFVCQRDGRVAAGVLSGEAGTDGASATGRRQRDGRVAARLSPYKQNEAGVRAESPATTITKLADTVELNTGILHQLNQWWTPHYSIIVCTLLPSFLAYATYKITNTPLIMFTFNHLDKKQSPNLKS